MANEEIGRFIDRELDLIRPERYDPRETSWRDPVVAEVERLIPDLEAKAIAARELVGRREGRATRVVTEHLREIHRTRQPPLDWMDHGPRPLALDGERVRLDAAGAADFRDWATTERKRNAQQFTARNDACEGADWIADQLDAAGAATLGDLWGGAP